MPGGSFAMWLIHPKILGKGYGSKMLDSIDKKINVVVAIGSNTKTSVPIYLKKNFSNLNKFNRYVIPFHLKYKDLLIEKIDKKKLIKWINEVNILKKNINMLNQLIQIYLN